MSALLKLTLLPIDECEEWIWDILDSTKDCGFEYLTDESRDFLIFNTNDFHADTKALHKIKRITGMRPVQMSTHGGNSHYGFIGHVIIPTEAVASPFHAVITCLFYFKVLFINIHNKINYTIKYNSGKPIE